MTETNVLPSVAQHRIYAIDVLRGLVMVIMALDHTRDFFHAEAFTRDPLDPATTNILMFFTRFITHYCAPVFILLAGTSIYLQSLRKSKAELSAFLFKRGLWLIVVELILITFAWTFDFSYSIFILQVIWAIGVCMVLMGGIIRLPYMLILAAGFT
ncbi:MAG TPA: heparan-alpha-glucosaminide N-acetyltransferase domain-containing protein, partial [Saprospiraceae bacterium]|nr:heparan-alpha-glucosaminide N-acetyltransferase domain-containing protein [Saprospiraceae bacterium]